MEHFGLVRRMAALLLSIALCLNSCIAAAEEPCQVKLSASGQYAMVGKKAMQYTVSVSGGKAPYTISAQITKGGSAVYSVQLSLSEAGKTSFSYMPANLGEHAVSVKVKDAAGVTAGASARMPVAVNEYEPKQKWDASVSGVSLTGDWTTDLIAIARTQVGQTESKVNFVIEGGVKRGYSRYGHWYGTPYGDWCTMFIGFCLEYAGIPKESYPCYGGCSQWKNYFLSAGAYVEEESDYSPQPGDLVFFNWHGDQKPAHAAIVTGVTSESISIIEGNRNNQVMESSYALDDPFIVGYASMSVMEKNAGITK